MAATVPHAVLLEVEQQSPRAVREKNANHMKIAPSHLSGLLLGI